MFKICHTEIYLASDLRSLINGSSFKHHPTFPGMWRMSRSFWITQLLICAIQTRQVNSQNSYSFRNFLSQLYAKRWNNATTIQVYSLIGGFCGSPVNFHAKDGSGYKFLGDIVVQLDKINPQVASRMVSAFSRWKRYDETRQALAKVN